MIKRILEKSGRYNNIIIILHGIKKNNKISENYAVDPYIDKYGEINDHVNGQQLKTEAEKLAKSIQSNNEEKLELPALTEYVHTQIAKMIRNQKEKIEQILNWKTLELVVLAYDKAEDQMNSFTIPIGWYKNPTHITAAELRPNKTVRVRGNVEYSHIATHIQGEELEIDIRRRLNHGLIPIRKAYTTITIKNPQIIPMGQTNRLTLEETYIKNHIYKTRNQSNHYWINNKSPEKPHVLIIDENNPAETKQIELQSELPKGLDVTLILHSYNIKSKSSDALGFSLDEILVNDPSYIK